MLQSTSAKAAFKSFQSDQMYSKVALCHPSCSLGSTYVYPVIFFIRPITVPDGQSAPVSQQHSSWIRTGGLLLLSQLGELQIAGY